MKIEEPTTKPTKRKTDAPLGNLREEEEPTTKPMTRKTDAPLASEEKKANIRRLEKGYTPEIALNVQDQSKRPFTVPDEQLHDGLTEESSDDQNHIAQPVGVETHEDADEYYSDTDPETEDSVSEDPYHVVDSY